VSRKRRGPQAAARQAHFTHRGRRTRQTVTGVRTPLHPSGDGTLSAARSPDPVDPRPRAEPRASGCTPVFGG
jgi:hypothetical protein